jgi:UDP-2,3-diacylglucosamine hydrolase
MSLRIKDVCIKEKAVFIADVHYKKGDKRFLNLLKEWIKNPPSQVFFLGDIFHLLLPFKYLISYNKEAIELINDLSKKTEVFYTPGNHDFNISSLFPGVVFADAFVDKKKGIFLTHGDLTDKDRFYKLYVKLIRNYLGNKLLNILTFNFLNNWLFRKILQKKIKCLQIPNFRQKVFLKTADINYKIIVEGHYHQNKKFVFENKTYINLGAFVCNQSYFVFENNDLKELTYGS